jgi:Mn2+/Fe2+ NRAMP family transporter
MMAGAAIGVSHIYQSTRAGADYGLQLLLAVLLVNLFKYPFFEYGHRYAASTGENLLQGYLRLGKGYLYAFLVMNAISAVVSIAGVTFVTAVLAQNLMPWVGLSPAGWSALLMTLCVVLLSLGRFRWLDRTMKVLMLVLFFTTLTAFFLALGTPSAQLPGFVGVSPWTLSGLAFVIALMGWMPAPIEISVWQSLWIQAKNIDDNQAMTPAEARIDFNLGYFSSIIMAVIFVYLGAHVMYGSGESFSGSAGGFATQFVKIYTARLGDWARPIIAISAFSTMLSTTLTCIDGFPRSLQVGWKTVRQHAQSAKGSVSVWLMVIVCVLSLSLITVFLGSLKGFIDMATSLTFLSAPYYGFLNYKVITSSVIPPAEQPGRFMRCLSVIGLFYFLAFGLLYIYSLFL